MANVLFEVEADADRWWVVIEPINKGFESPTKERSFNVPEGTPAAVVYFVEGDPGETFKLTGKVGSDVVVTVERTISAKGFAYGHKGFKV